jgi:hypothetical protein
VVTFSFFFFFFFFLKKIGGNFTRKMLIKTYIYDLKKKWGGSEFLPIKAVRPNLQIINLIRTSKFELLKFGLTIVNIY